MLFLFQPSVNSRLPLIPKVFNDNYLYYVYMSFSILTCHSRILAENDVDRSVGVSGLSIVFIGNNCLKNVIDAYSKGAKQSVIFITHCYCFRYYSQK